VSGSLILYTKDSRIGLENSETEIIWIKKNKITFFIQTPS
nr:hypothetical protein [Candidatus Anoxychlamydiales bacterium]